MPISSKNKLNKGQSFFEMVVAVAVVSIALIALVGLVTKAVANSTFARNQSVATRHTQEALEWIRRERDSNWTNISSRANGSSRCLGSLNWSSGCSIPNSPFTRRVILQNAGPQVVTVTVITSWTSGQGTHEAVAKTSLSEWRAD